MKLFKQNLVRTSLILIFVVPTAFGCATKETQERVNQKILSNDNAGSGAELRQQTKDLILNTPGLTDDQRQKLTNLQMRTRLATDELAAESLRLRSTLIRELVSNDYKESDLRLMQKRIRDNQERRLSVTFRAIEDAKVILGRAIPVSHQQIMDSYFDQYEM